MTRYLYEVELRPDEESGYSVKVPDLDGCYSQGDSISEALEMAVDALITYTAALLKCGDVLPEPTFGHVAPAGGMVVALSFEADANYIIDGVSPSEAAMMLGVSRGRVSQMIRDGVLATYKHAGTRYVDLESIHARLAAPPSAGRPRKEFITT